MRCSRASLFILEGGTLHRVGEIVRDESGPVAPSVEEAAIRAAHEGRTINLTDVHDGYADDTGLRSQLAVPVVVNGEVNAVLQVESRSGNAFSESDLMLMELQATLVAFPLGKIMGERRCIESIARAYVLPL
jgi:GAF domain-containing protein